METIIVILFGLVWGSFLNVVVYRLPQGKSIIKPASSCPHCGTRINWYDNIPLLSYLLLKGKCRACRRPISIIYPIIEALTAALLLILYYHYSLSLHFLAAALFTSALITLGFIDFKHQILPDHLTIPLFLLSLIYGFLRSDLNLKEVLLGAFFGSGFLFLIYVGYFLIRKKEGLGTGDIILMLGIGSFLGLKGTILTLILATFAGALVGLFLLLGQKKEWQTALPFGSFLTPAAFISLVWGEKIIVWYFSLFSLPG
ncbi:MAG: prepilin peptidase [Candidatus Aminicenantes bacterium]|nr:prepilin peptidase [Candidatus Aminicenantes bacterium]